jgi:hypothetical protein
LPQTPSRTNWGPILVLGSIWGLSEAALGLYLRQCASTVSGSLMTGASLFFLAAAWVVAPRVKALALMVLIASAFKLFDALLLGLPVLHGAVANPIFAMVMQGAAFLLIISLIRETLARRPIGQGLAGGLSALVAVSAFPLVRFATGIAACVVAGTTIPLSLYYAPIAIALSALTVPLGFAVGARITALETRLSAQGLALARRLSPAVLALSLAALALLRLV